MNLALSKIGSALLKRGGKSPALLLVVGVVIVAAYFDFLPSQVVVEVCSSAFGTVTP